VLALAMACERAPTTPTPSEPVVTRVEVIAPRSLAPGANVQLQLIGHRTNGSTLDLTSTARFYTNALRRCWCGAAPNQQERIPHQGRRAINRRSAHLRDGSGPGPRESDRPPGRRTVHAAPVQHRSLAARVPGGLRRQRHNPASAADDTAVIASRGPAIPLHETDLGEPRVESLGRAPDPAVTAARYALGNRAAIQAVISAITCSLP
jgi:hypothetical protein